MSPLLGTSLARKRQIDAWVGDSLFVGFVALVLRRGEFTIFDLRFTIDVSREDDMLIYKSD